jgi:hypothetical protein
MNQSRLALALLLQIILLGGFFWPSVSRAGWDSGCGPVGPVVQADRWTFFNGCWYLYRGNVQVAGYDPETKIYRTYDATTGAWGAPQTPPWAPCSINAPKAEAIEQNFGVDRAKITGHNRYTLNGREVAKEQIDQALIGKDTLADDSAKLRLTIIGNDAERKAVLDDLQSNPALAPLKDSLVVQNYVPTDWATRPGFVTVGHPTIYLQAPDGKVLYHRDDYQQGPQGLAGAVRKAQPSYDPAKDPNGNPLPLKINWGDLEPYAPLGVLGVLAVIAAAANMKRKS